MAGDVGARIREAREAAGLSQNGLAQAIGVTSTTIYRWEKGRQGVPKDKLEALARELHRSEAWLDYGIEDSIVEPEDSAAWLDLEERGVIDHFRREGVPAERIEHVRRDDFMGGATRRAITERLRAELEIQRGSRLDAELGEEPPEMAAARARRRGMPEDPLT